MGRSYKNQNSMAQCDKVLCPVQAAEMGDDESPPVRHAETPDLAREALVDAVILIFKAQVTPAVYSNCLVHMLSAMMPLTPRPAVHHALAVLLAAAVEWWTGVT